MKKGIKRVTICMCLLMSYYIQAQKENVIGFWQVENVEVGKYNKTPIAKWIRINADGIYQSGNGWLQHEEGTWKYDEKENKYSVKDNLGIIDEFGGFTVSFKKEQMIWKREEEGMLVKVTLSPITKLPMAPADYLEGVWELKSSKKSNKYSNGIEKNTGSKLFFKWGRTYTEFVTGGKRKTGYWYIHGHKPEVTLLSHEKGKQPETWKIEVNEKELHMKGVSDSNKTIERIYVRRNSF
ncbi:hypothetical protein [Tenacibaculum amylolyticum]|uniref:hypothetical protein n=1 Tax=Tenacibaculum amylolyticum TaxID=104269 RepID=UPI003893581A